MSLLELRKKFLAVLLVSFMALGMAACSTTEESPDSDDGGGESQSYEECKAACGEGDLDCREMCVIEAPV
jgi:hypothetical protein